MNTLHVYLLGQVRVLNDASPQPAKVPHHVQALLAYLILHRHRSHVREVLAELFWGDHSQDRARSCMNTSVWRLRQVLEPEGTPRGTFLLSETTREISFNILSDYWLDVAVLEEQSTRMLQLPVETMQEADAQALRKALQLYTGDLLEGFYEDWALRERERLRQLHLNSLVHLMRYFSYRHAFDESLQLGQRVLDHEPLREEIQREMMWLYAANGQRAQALQQYEVCRKVLAAELGIAPMEETEILHAEIVSGTGPQQLGAHPTPVFCYQDVLYTLRLALQSFDETRAHLQRVVQLLEGSVE